MDELFIVDLMQNALESDCLLSSHPVMTPVEHPDEIAEIFDAISYEKGDTMSTRRQAQAAMLLQNASHTRDFLFDEPPLCQIR
jgi:hypothetical protein